MKKLLIAATLALPLLASAQNLLINGSFESGLTGWTVTQSPSTIFPISTVTYGTLPGAFGEIVPADNNPINQSPDAVGTRAAYFVDDNAVQSLSQSFTVTTGGLYNIGLSIYLPANGFSNAGEATITLVTPNGTEVAPLSTLAPSVWFGGNVIRTLTPGNYTYSVQLATTGGVSKDLLIDRAYVAAVPEPTTYAMLLAGLGVMGLVAARRRRD